MGRHAAVRPPRRTADGFRRDVQGLRALAVTLVVVYHLYPGTLTGGYVGVDVFFVISGYLITGLLTADAERTGRVRLLGFYARRARRLLPAATLVLTVTWLVGRTVLPVTQLSDTATQIRASALYVQNWVLAHNSVDYLKSDNAATPVQHFWSLSVEEQFYLIWPLVMLIGMAIVLRTWRRNASLALAVVIAAASLAYSVHETNASPAAAYFNTGTRMWELALGAILALLPHAITSRLARLAPLSWLGLAMIVIAAVADGPSTPFPGTAALLPVLGAGLMLACGSGRGSTAVLTTVSLAVFIGDLSYGIYLWHWPMIVEWKAYDGGSLRVLDGPALAIAAVLAAWITQRLVENPIRRGAVFTRSNVRGLAVVAVTVVPVALVSVYLASRPTLKTTTITAAHAGAQVIEQTPHPSSSSAARPKPAAPPWLPASAAHTGLSPRSSKIIPSLATVSTDYEVDSLPNCKSSLAATWVNSCTFGDTVNPRLTVALVGDSHAGQWSTALEMIAKSEHWKLIAMTHDSCTFGSATLVLHGQTKPFTACDVWNSEVLSDLIKRIKPAVVIVSSRATAGVVGHRQPDATSFATIARGEVSYWNDLRAHHIGVVAIHETPEPGKNIPDCLASRGATVDGCAVSAAAALMQNTPLDQAGRLTHGAVPVINMNRYLCTPTACPAVVGDVIVYRDDQHLSATYTKSVEPYLRTALLKLSAFAGRAG